MKYDDFKIENKFYFNYQYEWEIMKNHILDQYRRNGNSYVCYMFMYAEIDSNFPETTKFSMYKNIIWEMLKQDERVKSIEKKREIYDLVSENIQSVTLK